MAGEGQKAKIGLELDIKGFTDMLALAQRALLAFAAGMTAIKIEGFFQKGIAEAIKFGDAAYQAANKLNAADPGKLFLVQKTLEMTGLSAAEAQGKIESYTQAGIPLANMFRGGDSAAGDQFNRASKQFGEQAKVLSEAAEKFAYIQQQMNTLATKLQGFFLGLADAISGPLSHLLELLNTIDLVSMGKRFGGYIATAVEVIYGAFKNGTLFAIAGEILQIGFLTAVDEFYTGVKEVMKMAESAGVDLAQGILAVLTELLNGVGVIENALLAAAKVFVDTIIEGLKQIAGVYDMIFLTNHKKEVEDGQKVVDKNLAQKAPLTIPVIEGAKSVLSAAVDKMLPDHKGQIDALQVKLANNLDDAAKTGAKDLGGTTGKMNPVFPEKNDAIGFISDSLAKVGGGGRSIRTGLSAAEKAAIDAARTQKEILAFMQNATKTTTAETVKLLLATGF